MAEIRLPRWCLPQVTTCREAKGKWYLTLPPRRWPSQATVWSGRQRGRMVANPPGKVRAYRAVLVADKNCWGVWDQCYCPLNMLDSASVGANCLRSLLWWRRENWLSTPTSGAWAWISLGFVWLIGVAKFTLKWFLIAKCSLSELLLLQAQKNSRGTTPSLAEPQPWANATRQESSLPKPETTRPECALLQCSDLKARAALSPVSGHGTRP